MTVSAPQRTDHSIFSTSSCVPLETGLAPRFAFTLVLLARPMTIGSRFIARWRMFAGMIMRPAAISSRTCSALRCVSRSATRLHLGRDRAEARVLELGDGDEACGREREAGARVARPAVGQEVPRGLVAGRGHAGRVGGAVGARAADVGGVREDDRPGRGVGHSAPQADAAS
jgi:hypothetical protein